jgi:hypothetical protein
MTTGRELRVLRGGGEDSLPGAFSPDGQLLAAVGQGRAGSVQVWETATGLPVRRIEPGGNGDFVTCVAFCTDGRHLAVGTHGQAVVLWDLAAGEEVRRLTGHRGAITSLDVSADGRLLVSGSADTTALVWDLAGARREPPGQHLSAEALQQLWADLADRDAARAFQAAWALAAAPGDAVPFLAERLSPTEPADPRRVARLVGQLDDDRFEAREQAAKELERLERLAEPALRRALDESASPEVRRRVRQLLERVEEPCRDPGRLRSLRALGVLGRAQDGAATRLLESLAGGAPQAWFTRQSRAALERLADGPRPGSE